MRNVLLEVCMRYFESREKVVYFSKGVRKSSREAKTIDVHIENGVDLES